MNKIHPFHFVDLSPWPILGALSVMSLLMGSMKWFHLFKFSGTPSVTAKKKGDFWELKKN